MLCLQINLISKLCDYMFPEFKKLNKASRIIYRLSRMICIHSSVNSSFHLVEGIRNASILLIFQTYLFHRLQGFGISIYV